MGRRLTRQQQEDRQVSRIISRIMSLEKVYDARMVERACAKYKMAMASKRKALKQKEQLERELADIKRRLR